MPKKTVPDNPYDYDANTIRVGQHDLARPLLTFRSVIRTQPPGSWEHMRDYDLSFERLPDAVDLGVKGIPGGASSRLRSFHDQ
ncbi:hypothetical protein [Streptomyces sp. NPDC005828]|uniref:hypothetical protein n=1 Tax=Streptomyces sp. NPDC005828 TaxID=3157071 RepID=UPI0033CF68CA